jgi:hypothetical protein
MIDRARSAKEAAESTRVPKRNLARPIPCVAAILVSMLALTSLLYAGPAVPLDPIPAIVKAFDDHTIVALGAGIDGNIQINELRLRLIRDPGFQTAARDIVVEFGNSRYQSLIDRFVRGADVPESELRKVWQDTAQANPVWDVPVYEQFYRAVRDLNRTLSARRRLRVVLGDVPIDWSRVRRLDDYSRQPRSDAVTANIIRREVLERGHRALLLMGEFHLLRHSLVYAVPPDVDRAHMNSSVPDPPSIVATLEAGGTKVFSIYSLGITDITGLQPDIAQWQPPALALIAGTPLGAAPFTAYNPTVSGAVLTEAGRVRAPVDPNLTAPMEQQYDAVLYLGPPSALTFSLPSPDLCRDKAYLDMRFFRMKLLGFDVESAKQYCRMVAP